MDRASTVFCIAALVATLVVSAVGFHFAALPAERLAAAQVPQPPEALPDIEVTGGFGPVSVLDLVGFWLENPPEAPAAGAAPPSVRRFGGC
jgi:hypothetical protein